jgi:hypothetical protein
MTYWFEPFIPRLGPVTTSYDVMGTTGARSTTR